MDIVWVFLLWGGGGGGVVIWVFCFWGRGIVIVLVVFTNLMDLHFSVTYICVKLLLLQSLSQGVNFTFSGKLLEFLMVILCFSFLPIW